MDHQYATYSNQNRKVNFESVKPKWDNLQKYKVNVKNIDFIIDSASKRFANAFEILDRKQ
jgi:hypothetical protein